MKKLAPLCLILLISLSSACAGKVQEPVYTVRCPRPDKPQLPKLAGLSFLESGRAYVLIRQRDRYIRDYIAGLEDALECYERQLPMKRE